MSKDGCPDRAIGRTLTDSTGHTVHIVGVARTHTYRALRVNPLHALRNS